MTSAMRMAVQLLEDAGNSGRAGISCAAELQESLELEIRAARRLGDQQVRPEAGQGLGRPGERMGHHRPDAWHLVGDATRQGRVVAEEDRALAVASRQAV